MHTAAFVRESILWWPKKDTAVQFYTSLEFFNKFFYLLKQQKSIKLTWLFIHLLTIIDLIIYSFTYFSFGDCWKMYKSVQFLKWANWPHFLGHCICYVCFWGQSVCCASNRWISYSSNKTNWDHHCGAVKWHFSDVSIFILIFVIMFPAQQWN